MKTSDYQSDFAFLAAHTSLLELSDGGEARVLVAPEGQGRVMTSTFGGARGPSFGWLNRPFISARRDDPKFNDYRTARLLTLRG
jgi:hypothetical protein